MNLLRFESYLGLTSLAFTSGGRSTVENRSQNCKVLHLWPVMSLKLFQDANLLDF